MMKKFLVAFVALVALALSTTAFAQVKEFGPSFNRFTVDVPAGWTAKSESDGCFTSIVNVKTDNVLNIIVDKHQGRPVKQFLINMAKSAGITNPVVEKQDDNIYTVSDTVNGLPILCMVTSNDECFAFFALIGKDTETLLKIVATCEDK